MTTPEITGDGAMEAGTTPNKPKSKRGFASMTPEKRQEIASKGGKAVVAKYGKDHLSAIGAKGGEKVAENREHMAKIGSKGGKASRKSDGNQ